MTREKLIVSSSPHIRSNENVQRIMTDVVIALIPATFWGVYIFGMRAGVIVLLSILSAVLSEYLWQKLTGRLVTTSDCSAVVTGLLLALNLPPTVPFFMPILGSAFAIIIVKQLFGGIGQNFVNPALAARAFLMVSWLPEMTKWAAPFSNIPIINKVDIVSSATPLALLKGASQVATYIPSHYDLFIGRVGGCIGETSALLLIIGGLYLYFRKVISLRIPISFILTVFAISYIFGGKQGYFSGDGIYYILSGGLMLGAFFMATDYSSSPVTPVGQIIMGIGCGIITCAIRFSGGYPEGVMFAILLMNVVVPLIDKLTVPKRFGEGVG